MSVIGTVIDRTGKTGVTFPILPEYGSTMQAFLLRIQRRYTQMGLVPREWGNARIDHLVGPALTYWMYLRRTIDPSDWATVQRRLLERFDKTMSQSQLLTELANARWNGNPKAHTDRSAAVEESGLGVAPDELADYYCTGLKTALHLLITNNGQVKYRSWGQAATAAARLYEPKQSVLELRERTSRAIRAAIQADGPRRRQEIEYRPGGTHANCYECPSAIPVSLEWGNQLRNTAEGTNTSDGHAEGTQPLWKTQLESGSASIPCKEAPGATMASSRKSAEATEDGYRSDATELAPHWWQETCAKEPQDTGGALCYVAAMAVLRNELAGSPCEALLETGASRSFISPKTVERLQLKVRRLPEEHRLTEATGE
ncbi:hypothetical protein ENH_00035710 [Eimeria necatrix]|uniref:Uncharacterized protein n=1 Tax=Eimeria necatrix TaxID=51315 RepID=U6ML02_9EIME|nr:hypothetical protein ENH_00035710 [Eimeria necatrix]CDJ63124.1 hypothetical protein ENH_00035710 [Eimeria necatrix]